MEENARLASSSSTADPSTSSDGDVDDGDLDHDGHVVVPATEHTGASNNPSGERLFLLFPPIVESRRSRLLSLFRERRGQWAGEPIHVPEKATLPD